MQMNKWDTEEGETWWRKVSGPKEYLKQVESLIRNGKCDLLQMEDVDTTFFQILRDRLLRSDSSLTFTVMDTAGCVSSTDFLAALVRELGPRCTPGFLDPYGDIIKSGILAHRILQVTIPEGFPEWIKKVIDGFSKVSEAGNESMIFLSSNPPDTDICKTVRLEEFVSSYDIQFFALHCLGPFETEDSKGAYIAQLVSNLVGLDSRLAARLAGYSLYADPVSCYKGKEESGKLLSDDRIQEAIWEAQIRFVLPITEKFRRYIIKKYEDTIVRCLPADDDFGNRLEVPQDMELRHLQHFLRGEGISPFSGKDDDLFKVAYNARNDLSHLGILSSDILDRLFSMERMLDHKNGG